MSELAWFLVPICAALWMAGGTWWKPLRRYAYPLVLGGGLAWAGMRLEYALLLALGIGIVAHLGYGDGSSWLKRWGVGLAYGLCLAPLGILGVLFSTLAFVGSLWLSRKLDKAFPHKLVELIHGGYFAGAVVWLGSQ